MRGDLQSHPAHTLRPSHGSSAFQRVFDEPSRLLKDIRPDFVDNITGRGWPQTAVPALCTLARSVHLPEAARRLVPRRCRDRERVPADSHPVVRSRELAVAGADAATPRTLLRLGRRSGLRYGPASRWSPDSMLFANQPSLRDSRPVHPHGPRHAHPRRRSRAVRRRRDRSTAERHARLYAARAAAKTSRQCCWRWVKRRRT